MKKLAPIVVVVAVSWFLLMLLLRLVRLNGNPHELFETTAVFVGRSMMLVGVVAMLLAAVSSGDKAKLYQGGFCVLMGVTLSAFSLPALVAALGLVAWMDYRGHRLN